MTKTMTWYCPKCGHVVISEKKPEPIRWSDGHVCYFKPEIEEGEAFKVSDQKAKEEQKTKLKMKKYLFCPNCTHLNVLDAKKCSLCGYTVLLEKELSEGIIVEKRGS